MTTSDERPRGDDSTPKAANIFDVARLAGVSHQTVSRVLNDLPNVRPTTRARVERRSPSCGTAPPRRRERWSPAAPAQSA